MSGRHRLWGAVLWLSVSLIAVPPGWAMMGGRGGMMDGGRTLGAWIGRLLDSWTERSRDEAKQQEALRWRIQEKRRDLSHLLQADNPDRDLIEQKIEELNALESQMDRGVGWKKGETE